jgi:hypothetical protein
MIISGLEQFDRVLFRVSTGFFFRGGMIRLVQSFIDCRPRGVDFGILRVESNFLFTDTGFSTSSGELAGLTNRPSGSPAGIKWPVGGVSLGFFKLVAAICRVS